MQEGKNYEDMKMQKIPTKYCKMVVTTKTGSKESMWIYLDIFAQKYFHPTPLVFFFISRISSILKVDVSKIFKLEF